MKISTACIVSVILIAINVLASMLANLYGENCSLQKISVIQQSYIQMNNSLMERIITLMENQVIVRQAIVNPSYDYDDSSHGDDYYGYDSYYVDDFVLMSPVLDHQGRFIILEPSEQKKLFDDEIQPTFPQQKNEWILTLGNLSE